MLEKQKQANKQNRFPFPKILFYMCVHINTLKNCKYYYNTHAILGLHMQSLLIDFEVSYEAACAF